MTLAIFPTLDGIEYPITQRADFNTQIFTSLNGSEFRHALYATPKTTFKLSLINLIREAQADQLADFLGFLCSTKGQYGAFLYDNPTDNSAVNDLISMGDGSTTAFQLARIYGGAAGSIREIVQSVNTVDGIYANGELINSGGYSVDDAGIVTFLVAPPADYRLTWSGRFYYRCRFTQDGFDIEQQVSTLHQASDIEFIGAVSNRV
jgi:uncharacterized protein (TIGR02217 family)